MNYHMGFSGKVEFSCQTKGHGSIGSSAGKDVSIKRYHVAFYKN